MKPRKAISLIIKGTPEQARDAARKRGIPLLPQHKHYPDANFTRCWALRHHQGAIIRWHASGAQRVHSGPVQMLPGSLLFYTLPQSQPIGYYDILDRWARQTPQRNALYRA